KLRLIDAGGYGSRREYQRASLGETHAVDLVQPDFGKLCDACGVPVRVTTVETLSDNLRWALALDGPAVVIFQGLLGAAQPTP
ncbi:MAG TPA: thiamine pyrophosphate-dependent enzyme, partial [Candidatus Dormibacteraeota bacterium]|nr:thiamine pyrophosphate-dependent enzyme [Candidatus Dormibacteraeota bacterium]